MLPGGLSVVSLQLSAYPVAFYNIFLKAGG